MWRHIPANEAGWVVPDVYIPALKAQSHPPFHPVPLGEGAFCWMGRTKDSLLIESVDAFLASKRARRIQGFYGRDSYHDDWLKPIELSPFDAYFTDSERFDRYTLTALGLCRKSLPERHRLPSRGRGGYAAYSKHRLPPRD